MDLFDIVAGRQGGGGTGAPQVQSNWDENDSGKKSYIKNKPFHTEVKEAPIVFTATDTQYEG